MGNTQRQIKSLRNKADKLLQEYIRATYSKCEVCGSPCQVGHHIFTKASSNNLRYDLDNIAHLCNGCHLKHHTGDPRIMIKIKDNRSDTWWANLNKKRNIIVKVNIDFYKEAIKKLST